MLPRPGSAVSSAPTTPYLPFRAPRSSSTPPATDAEGAHVRCLPEHRPAARGITASPNPCRIVPPKDLKRLRTEPGGKELGVKGRLGEDGGHEFVDIIYRQFELPMLGPGMRPDRRAKVS